MRRTPSLEQLPLARRRRALRPLLDHLSAVAVPLTLHVTGSGFAPGETVVLAGTDEPSFVIPTGDPMAPLRRVASTK